MFLWIIALKIHIRLIHDLIIYTIVNKISALYSIYSSGKTTHEHTHTHTNNMMTDA